MKKEKKGGKKRGLSLEDKRNLIMKLFKDDPSFFHIKDIEKHAAKCKINTMLVKDIINGLIGDGLVESDKVGSSNYFWSLPTRVFQARKAMVAKLDETKNHQSEEIISIEEKINQAQDSRQDSQERKDNLKKYKNLISQNNECESIIKDFEMRDPERYNKLIKEAKVLNDLYDLWTDNTLCISQWLKVKSPNCNMEEMCEDLKDFHLFE